MYNNSVIGCVVYVKDIIFNDNNKRKLDHAYNSGRPCLIIYTDDEFDYFLPLTHSKKGISKNQCYEISNSDYEYKYKKTDDISRIILRRIYKRKSWGYGDNEIGKLKLDSYIKIIDKLKEYYNNDLEDAYTKSYNIKGER